MHQVGYRDLTVLLTQYLLISLISPGGNLDYYNLWPKDISHLNLLILVNRLVYVFPEIHSTAPFLVDSPSIIPSTILGAIHISFLPILKEDFVPLNFVFGPFFAHLSTSLAFSFHVEFLHFTVWSPEDPYQGF